MLPKIRKISHDSNYKSEKEIIGEYKASSEETSNEEELSEEEFEEEELSEEEGSELESDEELFGEGSSEDSEENSEEEFSEDENSEEESSEESESESEYGSKKEPKPQRPAISQDIGDRRGKLIFVNQGDQYYIFGDLSEIIEHLRSRFSRFSSEEVPVRSNVMLDPPSGYKPGYHFGPYNKYNRIFAKGLYNYVRAVNGSNDSRELEKTYNSTDFNKEDENEMYKYISYDMYKSLNPKFGGKKANEKSRRKFDKLFGYKKPDPQKAVQQMRQEEEDGKELKLIDKLEDIYRITDYGDNRVAVYGNNLDVIKNRIELSKYEYIDILDNRSDRHIKGKALVIATATRIAKVHEIVEDLNYDYAIEKGVIS